MVLEKARLGFKAPSVQTARTVHGVERYYNIMNVGDVQYIGPVVEERHHGKVWKAQHTNQTMSP